MEGFTTLYYKHPAIYPNLCYTSGLGVMDVPDFYCVNALSNDYVLIFVTKGKLFYEQFDQSGALSAGSYLFLDKRFAHSYRLDPGIPSEIHWLHISGMLASQIVHNIALYKTLPFTGHCGEVLTEIDGCIRLCRTSRPDLFQMSSRITGILHLIFREAYERFQQQDRTAEQKNAFRQRFDTMIRGQPLADLSLDFMCERMQMNKYYFSHEFKNTYGISPMRFVSNLKMDRAKYLLRNSDMSVSDIAKECGFSSSSYFCTFFKKTLKLSPEEFRAEDMPAPADSPLTIQSGTLYKRRFTMKEREMIRDLAKQYAEIVFSDEAKAKAENWGRLNALDANTRPPIIIDQLPWHEFGGYEDLRSVSTNPFLRRIEGFFRSQLFRVRHFGADLVLPPYYPCGKVFSDSDIGVSSVRQDETEHQGAQSHLFVDQLPDMESISKLKNHVVVARPEETAKNREAIEDVIGDILEVRPTGVMIWAAIWDRITFWKGAESCLYAVIDEPEFVHALMRRLVDIEMDYIDQLEAQNLLAAGPGTYCHCVETYVNEDRYRNIDQNHIRTEDCWISGAAQIFSEISPAMHDEFEIEYMKPLYDRFGWVNYGCCEPLCRKIDIIRKMKTVRSISASPWTDVNMQAEAMGGDFVMLRKPNPAYMRSGTPEADAVRAEAKKTLAACRRNGTPVAFVLKDLTTVNCRAEGLAEWINIVKAEIENS